MNFILLPSLRHAATVRTASLLYSDCEIKSILEKEAEISEDERRQLMEREIAEKVSSLLPAPLPKAVAKVIRPMHQQVLLWKSDHESHLKHIGTCCCSYLRWKTDGTLDRVGIAKKIVVNDNIDPKIRFTMACTYFLENDVVTLWEKYEEIKRVETAPNETNLAVQFWMQRLKKKYTKHWSEGIDDIFRNRSSYPSVIPTRISCFYHLLSRKIKQSINIFKIGIHRDDFELCLNKMDDTERLETFRSFTGVALVVCFDWPFRSLFIRMAKEAMGYLTAAHFKNVLYYMFATYNYYGIEDFYVFEEFWQMSPDVFKDEAKEHQPIIEIKDKWLRNEKIPQSFKEILKKYFD